jgi:hypothetical protein
MKGKMIIVSLPCRPAALRFVSLLAAVFALDLVAAESVASGPSPLVSPAGITITNSDGPRIQFAEPSYDFGKVDSGQLVKFDFVFTNTGNAVLEVTNVHPACGCTATGNWDKKVEPGKTGRIPIQFNSFGYAGQVQKTVTVSCNDPVQTKVMLELKGTIWKPIEVKPAYVMFNLAPDAQTNEVKVVKILNNLEEPVAIEEPVCTNATFRAALKTVREGKEYELSVTVVPPVGPGTASTPIVLKTSSSRTPTLTVTSYAVAQPALTISPVQLVLPPGPLTNELQRSVTIRNNTTNTIVLSEPSANAEGIKVLLREIQPGRLFSVLAAFPPGFQSSSTQVTSLTVKSTQPQFKIITIPVFQQASVHSTYVPGGSGSIPQAAATRVLPVSTTPIAMQKTTVR